MADEMSRAATQGDHPGMTTLASSHLAHLSRFYCTHDHVLPFAGISAHSASPPPATAGPCHSPTFQAAMADVGAGVEVVACAASASVEWVAVGRRDGTVSALCGGEERSVYKGHSAAVTALAMSRDGDTVASRSMEEEEAGRVHVWSTDLARMLRTDPLPLPPELATRWREPGRRISQLQRHAMAKKRKRDGKEKENEIVGEGDAKEDGRREEEERSVETLGVGCCFVGGSTRLITVELLVLREEVREEWEALGVRVLLLDVLHATRSYTWHVLYTELFDESVAIDWHRLHGCLAASAFASATLLACHLPLLHVSEPLVLQVSLGCDLEGVASVSDGSRLCQVSLPDALRVGRVVGVGRVPAWHGRRSDAVFFLLPGMEVIALAVDVAGSQKVGIVNGWQLGFSLDWEDGKEERERAVAEEARTAQVLPVLVSVHVGSDCVNMAVQRQDGRLASLLLAWLRPGDGNEVELERLIDCQEEQLAAVMLAEDGSKAAVLTRQRGGGTGLTYLDTSSRFMVNVAIGLAGAAIAAGIAAVVVPRVRRTHAWQRLCNAVATSRLFLWL